MNTLASIASIGVGATVGASCRYYIGVLSLQYLGKTLPYGTLISNIIGSFIAGILVVVILEKLLLSETYRLMLLIGLTGSLTTMSTLSFESLEMLSGGSYGQALLNILLNIGLSLLAAGAKGVGQPLTERDRYLCKKIAPMLIEMELIFVGLDVIGDYITEINVTSPTCIRELDRQFNLNISAQLLDAVEEKLALR